MVLGSIRQVQKTSCHLWNISMKIRVNLLLLSKSSDVDYCQASKSGKEYRRNYSLDSSMSGILYSFMSKLDEKLFSDHFIRESVAVAATALNHGENNERKIWI